MSDQMDNDQSWEELVQEDADGDPSSLQAYHYYKYSTVKRGRSQSTDGESLETHKRPCYERSLNQYYRERTHDLSSSSWNARVAKRAPSEETWNGPILNDVNQQQNMKPSSKKKSNLELLQDLDKKELQKLLLKALTTPAGASQDPVPLPDGGTSTVQNVIKSIAHASPQIYVSTGMQRKGPKYCNLFVSNLPGNFTDIDLATTFLRFGCVLSAKVCSNIPSTRYFGSLTQFGFVSFAGHRATREALRTMNNFELDGHVLRVRISKHDFDGTNDKIRNRFF